MHGAKPSRAQAPYTDSSTSALKRWRTLCMWQCVLLHTSFIHHQAQQVALPPPHAVKCKGHCKLLNHIYMCGARLSSHKCNEPAPLSATEASLQARLLQAAFAHE